jgi:predicted DNA-binding protein
MVYFAVSMPYGLKNALPTSVRAMHKTFGDLIRDIVEVYVDDIDDIFCALLLMRRFVLRIH